MFVYQAKNLITGDLYIGITCRTLEARRREHVKNAGKNKGYRFGSAIKRYGAEKFEFSVLEVHDTYQQLTEAERRLVALHNPEYNCTAGGDGILGLHMTEASRLKMREAKLRNPNRYWLGKKRSPETIEKIRIGRSAVHSRITAKATASRRAQAKLLHERQKKAVRCLNDGLVFSSGVEAGKHYGLCQTSVSAICTGRVAERKGLKFSFVENSGVQ